MDVPVRLRQHGPAQDGLWAFVLEARKDKAVAAFLHGQRGLGASFIMAIFRPGFDPALPRNISLVKKKAFSGEKGLDTISPIW
jgi:hypothetical protein